MSLFYVIGLSFDKMHLYLGRSRMCSILQETMFQDLVLKSSSLSKKQAKKCKFIKARQLSQQLACVEV